MNGELRELSWPWAHLDEAIRALIGDSSGFDSRNGSRAPSEDSAAVRAAAARAGVEAEDVELSYGDPAMLLSASPALLSIEGDSDERRLLAIRGVRRRELVLALPDRRSARVPAATVMSALFGEQESAARREAARLSSAARLADRSERRLSDFLTRQSLGTIRARGCWILRAPVTGAVSASLREAKVPALFALLVATSLLQQLAFVGSWWVLGRLAFRGEAEPDLFLVWSLLLATFVLSYLGSSYAGRMVPVRLGTVLKRRLLAGALHLDLDRATEKGSAGNLAGVIEAEALDTATITGFHQALTASWQLLLACVILLIGPGRALHTLLFVAWLLLIGVAEYQHYKSRKQWTDARFELGEDVTEAMLGHRTRLAQQKAEQRNDEEDIRLAHYARTHDRVQATGLHVNIVRRAWVYVGVLGLSPLLIAGTVNINELAVSVGGILLGASGMMYLELAASDAIQVAISWRRIREIWSSARRAKPSAGLIENAPPPSRLTADEVTFRYGSNQVLSNVTLSVESGARLLLEGESGAGKSTLALILAGLRTRDRGLVMIDGLDIASLGEEGWRRRVVLVPQFYQNHLFSGPLAYNVLMGAAWPPSPADLARAQDALRDVGLGPLLEQMPGGIHQFVGETGWRLSHGEMARVFLARALVQNAAFLILDESFGALDPDSLRMCLRAIEKQPGGVILISHR